ncbi:MAG: hypothetical protein LBS21_12820 [Clostridiales bacterium]|jgi:hypothetical protein|nr:hypothetical protein [Clostridiales bacterium]
MPENSLVYEIARMMNDKPAIQNDFNEAAKLVKKMFEDKYISRMNGLIKSHRNKLAQNPSREITLFQAFCAYMPEENRQSAEKFIDNLYLMETLSSIRNEFNSQPPFSKRESPAIFVNAQGGAQGHAFAEGYAGQTDSHANGGSYGGQADSYAHAASYTGQTDSSVHPDGVYDVDDQCNVNVDKKFNAASFLPVFLLLSSLSSNN